MANLNITESRLPQDGRIKLEVNQTTNRFADFPFAYAVWRKGRFPNFGFIQCPT